MTTRAVYCTEDLSNCSRWEFTAWSRSLAVNEEQTIRFVVTLPVGTYQTYAQVDVSWDNNPNPLVNKPFGLIQEAVEDNNVYTGRWIEVQMPIRYVYLPLVLKKSVNLLSIASGEQTNDAEEVTPVTRRGDRTASVEYVVYSHGPRGSTSSAAGTVGDAADRYTHRVTVAHHAAHGAAIAHHAADGAAATHHAADACRTSPTTPPTDAAVANVTAPSTNEPPPAPPTDGAPAPPPPPPPPPPSPPELHRHADSPPAPDPGSRGTTADHRDGRPMAVGGVGLRATMLALAFVRRRSRNRQKPRSG